MAGVPSCSSIPLLTSHPFQTIGTSGLSCFHWIPSSDRNNSTSSKTPCVMPKAGTEPILSFGTRWLVPAMMLFVGFNPVCLGQQPISGVVYSDSGEPLFGTSLSWSSETNDGVSGANTISSKQGYFSFEVSFPGKLSASILGFMPWDSLIQEQPSTPFHIDRTPQNEWS